MSTKTAPSLDNGVEFQSSLTVARANGKTTTDAPQIKAKQQAGDIRSQLLEIKRKVATSGTPDARAGVADIPPAKEAPPAATTPSASVPPHDADSSLQSSERTPNDAGKNAELTTEMASILSPLARISSVAQMPTNTSGAGWNSQTRDIVSPAASASTDNSAGQLPIGQTERLVTSYTALDAMRAVPTQMSGSENIPEGHIATSKTGQLVADASLSYPRFDTMQGAAPHIQAAGEIPSATVQATPATQESQSANAAAVALKRDPASSGSVSLVEAINASTEKQGAASTSAPNKAEASIPVSSAVPGAHSAAVRAAGQQQPSQVSTATDTTNSINATSTVDATSSATQHSGMATGQGVFAALSVPEPGVALEYSGMQSDAANSTLSAGKPSDPAPGGASRVASSGKTKPASGTSAPANRYSDSSGAQNQTSSASSTSVLPVGKAGGATAIGNQAPNDPKGVLELQTVQQMTQAVPSTGATHTGSAPQSTSAFPGAASQALPAQATLDSQPAQGLTSAQLIQSVHSSEMKLGMQSAEFGNISISTSLNHQSLSAQISIDHAELGKALAVHLPAIAEKLGSAYGVQAKVELRDSNSPPQRDSGYSSSGQQAKEHRQSQGGRPEASEGGMIERSAARTVFTQVSPVASASRLDIRV